MICRCFAFSRKVIVPLFLLYGSLLIFYYALSNAGQGPKRRLYWLESNFLFKSEPRQPRVLCAIMTIPGNHQSKTVAVRDTWAKRCDSVIYFTSSQEPDVFQNATVVIMNITQGRDYLWEKTRAAFLHMEEFYGKDFDWFLKSDDDTYFIVDNLRSFLSDYDPADRIWFGCEFVHHTSRQHFPSGGAGYVLSRGAVQAFAEVVYNETQAATDHPKHGPKKPPILVRGCGLDGGAMGEDVRFSLCLESAGVKLIDAQGPNGTFRFLPTMLEHFVFPERNGGNGWITMYRHLGQGIQECCDTKLISIHYAHPKLMYVYEFLIYHLRVANASVMHRKWNDKDDG